MGPLFLVSWYGAGFGRFTRWRTRPLCPSDISPVNGGNPALLPQAYLVHFASFVRAPFFVLCPVLWGLLVAGLVVGCAGEEPPPSPLLNEGELTTGPVLREGGLAPSPVPKEGGLEVSATLVSMPTLTVAPTPSIAWPTATRSATVRPIVTATFTATPTATPVPVDTATPTLTATSSLTPTATNSPEPTATMTPSATATATFTVTPVPTDTPMPSPTPNPLDGVRFVDNEDCVEGISRELLPTMELVIERGDASNLVVVEVADEARERQQGLMCRETVPNGSGMLFVFQSARTLSFWMFNTYVPLDIVYLDHDQRVVRAVRMEPCPRPEGMGSDAWRIACSAAATGYGSGGTALYALELPAGWLASVGLELENLEGVLVSW